MIELSDEQIQTLEHADSGPYTIVNPHTKEEYVLVRRAVYDRWRGLLDDQFSTEDAFPASVNARSSDL